MPKYTYNILNIQIYLSQSTNYIYKIIYKNPDQKTQKIINIQRISMISTHSELKKNYVFRDTYFFLDALRDVRAIAFFLLTSFVFQFLQ